MKKIFSLIILSFIIFSSCSDDDNVIVNVNPVNGKETSELTVRLSSNNITTKSVGYGDNGYIETKIINSVIATFFKDGSINVIKNATFSEGQETKLTFSLRPGDLNLYVIANVDISLFSKVSTEEQFKEVLLSLNQSTIPLSGKSSITIEANKTLSHTIYLERVVTKVSLASVDINQLATNGYANSTFKIDRVFLHNVNTKSTIDYKGSEKKSGLSEPTLLNYEEDFFGYYDRHYFYGFEGTLKLVIGGWFKDGDRAPEYVYYPLDIDAKHNTHYDISAVIKTKGVKTPDDKLENGILDLTIKVVDWTVEDINHVFE